MTVRRSLEKPSREVNIDALIERGAKVKEDNPRQDMKKWTFINLRIPLDLLNSLDDAVDNTIGVNRTGWILQAILEKLSKKD